MPTSSSGRSSYTLTCSERRGYLHVIVNGIHDADAALAAGQEIMAQSNALGFEYVIIEDRSDRPDLEPIETFAWLSEIGKTGRSLFKAAAVVRTKMGQDKQFVVSVAVSRGFDVALFRTVHEAQHWLLGEIDGARASGGAGKATHS